MRVPLTSYKVPWYMLGGTLSYIFHPAQSLLYYIFNENFHIKINIFNYNLIIHDFLR